MLSTKEFFLSAWLFLSWDICLILPLDSNLHWNLHLQLFCFSDIRLRSELYYWLSWVSSLQLQILDISASLIGQANNQSLSLSPSLPLPLSLSLPSPVHLKNPNQYIKHFHISTLAIVLEFHAYQIHPNFWFLTRFPGNYEACPSLKITMYDCNRGNCNPSHHYFDIVSVNADTN